MTSLSQRGIKMSTKRLHEDGLGAKGLSAHAFAERLGLSHKTILRYCKEGKIFRRKKALLN